MATYPGDFLYHGGIGSYAISLPPNRIIGTNNSDTLRGTSGDDEIHGKAGRDRIEGRGGDDFVLANQGNDSIYGDSGDDTMFGGKGEDHIYGDYGDDFCLGQRSDDILMGHAGHDFLHGGQGSDILIGEGGDDTLAGGQGNDYMRGDRGADLFALNGGGHDVIQDFDFSQGDRLLIPGGVTLIEAKAVEALDVGDLHDDIVDWLEDSPLLEDLSNPVFEGPVARPTAPIAPLEPIAPLLPTPIGGGAETTTVTTRLHHADGWVDLVGIDPADFSYDWLV